MRGKDEEHSEAVTEPSEGVEEKDPSRSVLSDEEVEKSKGHRVAREHVVPTRSNPLQTHPSSRPYDVGIVQTIGPSSVRTRPEYQLYKGCSKKPIIPFVRIGAQKLYFKTHLQSR